MKLKEYRKKRDFSRTPEPDGSQDFCKKIERKFQDKIPKKKKPLYMVHDHRSRSHHFDLRLEMEGVLKSWAIPKLIDLKDLYTRRLAIQTEDHPLAYGYWEGKIPDGDYGAGSSRIWDTGSFEVVDSKKDKLIFKVKGKRLQGTFVLIHFRPHERNWLFFKKKE